MAEKTKTLSDLAYIQSRLKAPKGQRNNFGNYNYRSCEDILEAVKPLLAERNCTLTISDDIIQVADRIYVKATATLRTDAGVTIQNTAFAREEIAKKGMDASQVTGAASSYARKYALNGLFCIDDTKDADALNVNKEYTQQPAVNTQQPADTQQPTNEQLQEAFELAKPDISRARSRQELTDIFHRNIPLQKYQPFIDALSKRKKEVAA